MKISDDNEGCRYWDYRHPAFKERVLASKEQMLKNGCLSLRSSQTVLINVK